MDQSRTPSRWSGQRKRRRAAEEYIDRASQPDYHEVSTPTSSEATEREQDATQTLHHTVLETPGREDDRNISGNGELSGEQSEEAPYEAMGHPDEMLHSEEEEWYDVNGDEGVFDADLGPKLAQWAVKHNVTHVALDALLAILAVHCVLNLPLTAKTLLQTPLSIRPNFLAGGKYHFFGIGKAISRMLSAASIKCVSGINLTANVDGLPLFKSSRVGV